MTNHVIKEENLGKSCFTNMNKTEALPYFMLDKAYEIHPFGVIDEVFPSPYLTKTRPILWNTMPY